MVEAVLGAAAQPCQCGLGTLLPAVPHFLRQRQVNSARGRMLLPSDSPGCCPQFINPIIFYGAGEDVAQACWGAWGPWSSTLVPLCWCHHIHSAPALGCGFRARQSLLHSVNLCKSFGMEMWHGDIQCLGCKLGSLTVALYSVGRQGMHHAQNASRASKCQSRIFPAQGFCTLFNTCIS